MTPVISLVPLARALHVDALQQVYHSVPRYWSMYDLSGAPDGQAQRDLLEAENTPGRTMMGIVRRLQEDDPAAGFELIGLIDFRLHWPHTSTAYLGMLMVAEPYQRRGVGSRAWALIAPWLAQSAHVETVRLGVEQFNTDALQFFRHIGFALTGDSNRISSGKKWVRLLYMEQSPERVSQTTH
jgi:ribosomal protein S18 acetylase RimI-like enzyme